MTRQTKPRENEIGTYCRIGVPGSRPSIRVRPKPGVLDAVAGRIVTDDDHLSWKVVVHDNGLALVILEHGYIIGSHWVAYIDADTIPAAEEVAA